MTYWEERQKQLNSQLEKDEEKLKRKLSSYYDKESRKLEKEIAAFYKQFGTDKIVEYRTLMQTMDEADRTLLIERMDEFALKHPEYTHLLPVRESIYKLDRLEGLQMSIKMQQLEMGAIDQIELNAHLRKQASRSATTIAKDLGFGTQFYTQDSDVIKKLVNKKWAKDGNFSDDIWRNRQKLAEYLNQDFAAGIARGDSYERIMRGLKQRFGSVARRDMYRLIYTEGTYVQNEASITPFEEDFEEYEIYTLDEKACDVCKALLEIKFKIKDRKPGVNFPPLHPWCRCTSGPVVSDWDAWTEKYIEKHGAKSDENDIIKSRVMTGAKKTPGWKDRHAERQYAAIRKKTTDYLKIANNTGFLVEDIQTIKAHMFIEKHKFKDGSVRRFDADFEQSQAWDRLSQGTHRDIDTLLLKHELEESKIMREKGLAYEDAHELADKKYNWWAAFLKEG